MRAENVPSRAKNGPEQVQENFRRHCLASSQAKRVVRATHAVFQDQNRLPRQTASLLDYLVGDREQRRRHLEAERLRGLEIDHQLELGRLLNRQFGRA